MEISQDSVSEKKRILLELSRCLKTVFVEASSSLNNAVHLGLNCPLIQCVDRALQHGLVNLPQSYWPLVRSCSHAQTLETIESWVSVQGSQRAKGKAWLLATLVEGSFLSYLQCITSETRTIERLYTSHALLRDPPNLSQLSSLLTGIESVNFLVVESAIHSTESSTYSYIEENTSVVVKPVLELALNGSNGLQGTVMTSSLTSSLASPGDSGFTQLDSETDTASFSEVILEADSTSMREDIAVLPVDPCTEKTIGCSSILEPMTVSDIANANTSSGSTNTSHWAQADDADELVKRRPQTKSEKVCYSKQQKRVSFHECTPYSPGDDTNASDVFSKESLSNSLRSSASNLSRAVGDFSSFEFEQEGVEIARESSILGDGIEETPVNKKFSARKLSDSALRSVKSLVMGQAKISEKSPVTERGMPEGQEDPPHRCSVTRISTDHLSIVTLEQSRFSNNSSPAPSCSSLKPQVSTPRRFPSDPNQLATMSCSNSVLSQTPSKACLVNRFLRSITEKKIFNRRTAAALVALNKRKSSHRKLNLFISGVKPKNQLSQELVDELEKEICNFTLKSSHSLQQITSRVVDITPHSNNFLHSKLELYETEEILKVLSVKGTAVDIKGARVPLFVILSNQALHVVDNKILRHSSFPLSEISTILVGPYSQWVSFISVKKPSQVDLLMSGEDSVSTLVGGIEMQLRRKGVRDQTLPPVVHLNDEIFMIPRWRSILQSKQVHNYSVVHVLEETPSPPCSPSRPSLKEFFMFKTHHNGVHTSWEPGYFILRAGVLYVSSDEEECPLYSIDLHGVKCKLISLSSRPHTIEVSFLHIAAPNDYVAQSWLSALQRSSLGMCEPDYSMAMPKLNIISGSLLLTESHLMLFDSFGIPKSDLCKLSKPLLSALVSNITSLGVGDQVSCWCVVEFSCREVHESSGDYVVFFSTCDDKLVFIQSLQKLSPILLENTNTLSEVRSLRQHCDKIAVDLSADGHFLIQ